VSLFHRARTIIAISTAITLATLSGAQAAVQTVEADNGEVYRITEIRPAMVGGVEAIVYPPGAPGDYTEPMGLLFDCKGHMKHFNLMGPMTYVPPRSVAGRIAAIACGSIPRH
jgi:hypothetical protein